MPHLEIPGGEDSADRDEELSMFDDPPEVDVDEVQALIDELLDQPDVPEQR